MKNALKVSRIMIITVILCIVFSSCSIFTISSVDTLIRAPKLTGNNALVQKAFEESVGKDISLLNPLTGDFRSAYVQYDYDNDSQEEVIVFYVDKNSESEVHLHFLDFDGEKWNSVDDIKGFGSEVYRVDFSDIDNDTKSEIAVIWTLPDSKRNKTLSFYKLNDDKNSDNYYFTSMATIQISDYMCLDVDFDGQNEIFYTFFDSSANEYSAYAKLLKVNKEDSSFYPVSEVALNKLITSFSASTYDIKDGTYRIYIDCQRSDGQYFTEVLYYDFAKSALITPFSNDPVGLFNRTARSAAIYSQDMNSDYLTEIPSVYNYPDSQVQGVPDGISPDISVLDWLTYTPDGLVSVKKYYMNEFDDYKLDLDSLYDRAYITYDYDNSTVQVRGRDYAPEKHAAAEPSEDANILFTIKYDYISADSTETDRTKFCIINVTDYGKTENITSAYVKSLIVFD